MAAIDSLYISNRCIVNVKVIKSVNLRIKKICEQPEAVRKISLCEFLYFVAKFYIFCMVYNEILFKAIQISANWNGPILEFPHQNLAFAVSPERGH